MNFKRLLDGARWQVVRRSPEDTVRAVSGRELTFIFREVVAEGMGTFVPLLLNPNKVIVHQIEVSQEEEHANTLDDDGSVA